MAGANGLANRIPARLTAAEGRQFGLTVGGAFLVLAAIAWWRGRHLPEYTFSGLGAALIAAGLLIPGRLGPVYRAWMGLAHTISKVTTPLFMLIVFFVVIMPVGLLMRIFGRNPVRHLAVNESYWMERSDARGNMTNQF
jgi:hypothetical protein